ncbi:hypothetical protein CQ12_36575 [Bradyrhizobium jicamae]|uniref:YjiS-like domain-containing protein n=1 Tax=Bradyrhizobium jicamae TaxID=280332 RepID=A0A0R3LEF5_9BRAD|nr:DUF1127 domain-containing protein [Bradyrhizobium jicamae]KRR04109.1 hypothetical protein CQ12_36575 [Bradyrhizobium jicamae]
MDTTYKVSGSKQTFAPIRIGLSLFGNCRAALLEWHERKGIRARLFDLSDRELHDIGISRGEIDYVASNRDIDPRGIRSAG